MSIITDEITKIKIIKGNMGLKIEGQRGKWMGVQLPKRHRGDITKFSNQSRRRLRETLALAKPMYEGYKPYGVCLTIPGDVLSPKDVRRLWHEFVANSFRRLFKMPMIWRIELQERKQAHWHCIVWATKIEDLWMMGIEWRRTVRRLFGPFEYATDIGFDNHGVDIRSLEDASATGIIGYLCDHQSKRKQAQLGWQGRQWGVVRRDLLDFSGDVVAELTEDEHKRVARQFRRLQERLREREGKYTGVRVPNTNEVSTAIFGNDEARWLKCVDFIRRGGG